MTLVSILNPVPEDVVRTIKTPDGAIAFCALGAAGRPQGHRLRLHRAQRADQYFVTVRDLRDRGFAVAMIDWRGQVIRRGPCAIRAGLCPRFLRFRNRCRNLRAAGGAAGLPAALFRAGAFDGGAVICGRACRQTLVRPQVLSAPMIDLPDARRRFRRARCCGSCGKPGRAPRSRRRMRHRIGILRQQPFTSDPVRFARNRDPGGSHLGIGSPTVAWADTAFRAMHGFRAANHRWKSASRS